MPEESRSAAPAGDVAHLALRIGRGMLSSGADAASVRQSVEGVVAAFRLEPHALVEAEAILVTVEGRDGFRTKIGRTLPAMAVDMDRLIRLRAIADAINAGDREPIELDGRLASSEAAPRRYSTPLVTGGMMITAGCLARLFGAEWAVVAASLVAGLVGTLIRVWLARAAINSTFAVFASAFASGLAAAFAIKLSPGSSATLCLTAAGMILVPGVPLINGVRDLVDGYAGMGLARLSIAAVTLLTIGFALYLAAGAAGDMLPVGSGPGRLSVGEDVVLSAVVTIGYATLFNVPWRGIVGCMACGIAGHGLRTGLESLGLDLVAASLLSAFVAGLVARGLGWAWRVPAVVFAFPGVVAMMPGSYAFRAGIGGWQLADLGGRAPAALVAETLSLTLTTMLVTAAIAVGLSIAFAIPQPVLSTRRS